MVRRDFARYGIGNPHGLLFQQLFDGLAPAMAGYNHVPSVFHRFDNQVLTDAAGGDNRVLQFFYIADDIKVIRILYEQVDRNLLDGPVFILVDEAHVFH